MHPFSDADTHMLRNVLDGKVSLPLVLDWINSSVKGSSVQGPHLAGKVAECENNGWGELLESTSLQSFAVCFLSYIRAEVQPLLRASGDSPKYGGFQPARAHDGSDSGAASGNSDGLGTTDQDVIRKAQTKSKGRSVNGCNGNLQTTSGTFEKSKQLSGRLSAGSGAANQAASDPLGNFSKDDFPALVLSSNITARQSATRSKQIRRVNPTPLPIPVIDNAFVLSVPESQQAVNDQKKNQLNGRGPLKVDMDVLMKRFEKGRKQKQKDVSEIRNDMEVKKSVCASPGLSTSSESTTGMAEPITAKTETNGDKSLPHALCPQFVTQNSSEKPVDAVPAKNLSKELAGMAAVHAKLLVSRMVPSLLDEIQLLLQLLCLEPSVVVEAGDSSGVKMAGIIRDMPIFCNGDDCAAYACAVLEKAGRILDCVGDHLLAALLEQPSILRHSPSLLIRIKGALVDHQAAMLRSSKAYEPAMYQSNQIECSPDTSFTKIPHRHATWFIPTSLPFQAARDSRNNFRTREEQKMYNNREQCRDQFYDIVRRTVSACSSFTSALSQSQNDDYENIKDDVRRFFKVLLLVNYPWFTELFLEQVLQVTACGETDPEVTGLVGQDPGKLQRLHDRLTSTSTTHSTLRSSQKQRITGPASSSILSPSSPWSKVKNMEYIPNSRTGFSPITSNGINTSLEKGAYQQRGTFEQMDGKWSHLSTFFPQSLQIYIWFLEAADSFRLNMQLIWSIKSKIFALAELPADSQDAADIGSSLTQRVLALKTLAGFLGYLFFSPALSMYPPAPGTGAIANWGVVRSEPPIDILRMLIKACIQQSILLTLPWVLEFLRFSKEDEHVLYQPYFKRVIAVLRNVYMVPMLDPSSLQFGVGSICILAILDGFFDFMCLSPCDTEDMSSNKGKDILEQNSTAGLCLSCSLLKGNEDSNSSFEGLDTMLGIVDTRFIQTCCPILMEMRAVLVNAKKRRNRQPSKLLTRASWGGQVLRKITPVERSKEMRSFDLSSKVLLEESLGHNGACSKKDSIKSRLQSTFFEQRPQLKRLVDFVVDTVAVNAAHTASLKLVRPALREALTKLGIALSGANCHTYYELETSGLERNSRRNEHVDAAAEHIINVAIHQALVPSLEYVRRLAAEKTVEALAALISPDETLYVAEITYGIAADAAKLAASRKALASISGEIRKRISKEVEIWSRNTQLSDVDELTCILKKQNERNQAGGKSSGENDHHELHPDVSVSEAVVYESPRHPSLENHNINVGIEISPRATGHGNKGQKPMSKALIQDHALKVNTPVKRQLSFNKGSPDSTILDIVDQGLHEGRFSDKEDYVLKQFVHASCALQKQIGEDPFSDEKRQHFRCHLAAMSMSMVGVLSQVKGGIPPGGIDALVLAREPHLKPAVHLSQNQELLGEPDSVMLSRAVLMDKLSEAQYRVEMGLIRRTVAIALRLCLLCPSVMFGVVDKTSFSGCQYCISSSHFKFSHSPLKACPSEVDQSKDLERIKGCFIESIFSGHSGSQFLEADAWLDSSLRIVQVLVSLWKSLVSKAICSSSFLIRELLAPWRWKQALLLEPWRSCNFWNKAVQHGVAMIVLELIAGDVVQETENIICAFVDTMARYVEEGKDILVRSPTGIRNFGWIRFARDLSVGIGLHLLENSDCHVLPQTQDQTLLQIPEMPVSRKHEQFKALHMLVESLSDL